jgi:hypothetical protein
LKGETREQKEMAKDFCLNENDSLNPVLVAKQEKKKPSL